MIFATVSLMAALALSGTLGAPDRNSTTDWLRWSGLYEFKSNFENEECGVRGLFDDRLKIIGGSDALPGEFPWQASLQSVIGHECGGSIISKDYVVSAAHCFLDRFGNQEHDKEGLEVMAGSRSLEHDDGHHKQRRRVSKIFINKYKYGNESSPVNDIALVKLAQPFDLDGKWVSPICLPPPRDEFTGTAVVTGWGETVGFGLGNQPDILQKLTVNLIPASVCHEDYPYTLRPNQMCAGYQEGGRSPCSGDSGGPLAFEKNGRYFLVGVVSWAELCAYPNQPSVFTEVAAYRDWILKLIDAKTEEELRRLADVII